jgi:heavy metal sensor kinase
VALLAVVLLLYSGAACFFLLQDLRRQLVRHAVQDIETVEGLIYFSADGQLKMHDDYHNHPESKRVLERLMEVRSPSGAVLFRNELLGSRSLGDTILPGEGEGGYSERQFTLRDGLRVQLVSRRHTVDGRPTLIRVAYSEQPLWNQFRADLGALLLPLPFVLLLAGCGGYLLASRSLRPLQAMARRAGEIHSDRLHERLPVNPSDGELAELSIAFNALLLRLEQSFDQLRRFTSDASHELRTPLAAMRSVGEVGLQKRCTEDGYRDVIGSMLEEANKLTRLVDTLLTMARADAGQIQLKPTVFSAADLARECGALFEVLLEEHGQRLALESNGDPLLRGDWLLLRQALVNVLHNAIKFTPKGGTITVRIRSAGEQVRIEVEDSGPGIPDADLKKVFDRFYRADEGRSRENGGTGLGLAIARWSVEMHGGTIAAHNNPPGGCVVCITLPAMEVGISPAGEVATQNVESGRVESAVIRHV